jgi:hypothetical protein
MITQTQSFTMKHGEIISFFSERLPIRFFVVTFYDWGYINIFDGLKENEAMKCLMERDVCSKDRDATMENPFLDDNLENRWSAFCALLEATNGDYENTILLLDEYFPEKK